jgi:hypothetical protein
MRNHSACERRAVAGAVFLLCAISCLVSLVAVSRVAIADEAQDRKQCSEAYDRTQALRREKKLQAAHDEAVACTRNVCAEFIRSDCVGWLKAIDASQPSVVVVATGSKGDESRAVRVVLDGKPWLDALDGTSKPIDPGEHTIHFETDGAQAKDQTVEIHEGEKDRKLTVTFDTAIAPVAPPRPEAGGPASVSPGNEASPSPAPWIIGGVGLASLLVGAITGGVVVHDHAVVTSPLHCDPTTKACDAAGASAARSGRVLGPLTTVTLIVGGVGVGVGVVWLIARPHSKQGAHTTAQVRTGPMVTSSGGAWAFEGTW